MGRFCDNARGKITNWDVSTGNKWQLAPEVVLITCSGFNVKSFPDSEWLTGFALKVSLMRGSCWNSRWNVYIDLLKSYFLLRNVLTLRGNCRQVAFETETSEHADKQKPRWTQHRKLDKKSYMTIDVSVHEQLTRVSMKKSANGHGNINK